MKSQAGGLTCATWGAPRRYLLGAGLFEGYLGMVDHLDAHLPICEHSHSNARHDGVAGRSLQRAGVRSPLHGRTTRRSIGRPGASGRRSGDGDRLPRGGGFGAAAPPLRAPLDAGTRSRLIPARQPLTLSSPMQTSWLGRIVAVSSARMMGVLTPTLTASCARDSRAWPRRSRSHSAKRTSGLVSRDGSGRSRLRQTDSAISRENRIAALQVLQRFEWDVRLLGQGPGGSSGAGSGAAGDHGGEALAPRGMRVKGIVLRAP